VRAFPARVPPDNEKLRTCYFGSSTIIVSKIKEIEEKGYFTEDEDRAPEVETMLEPNNYEAVVYEDFFVAGLHMLHFQAQPCQLTPNTIA
jgi:hypothetical protein